MKEARPPTTPTATELALWRQREDELDRADMRGRVAGFSPRLEAAIPPARALSRELEEAETTPEAIVVLGMGGSAIGGDLVAAALARRGSLPIVTVRSWDPPAWVDDRAFVIGSSYSGDTEETVAAYRTARERGARGAVVTTGGALGALAGELGDPVLALPGGLPPRAALPESLAACLLAAAALDPALSPAGIAEELTLSARDLEGPLAEWLAWDAANPAVGIAASCADRLPIVYGGHPVSVAAAARWKAQLNENAKIPAWSGAFPEHGHNEIMGFEGGHPCMDGIVLIYLETPWDDPRVARRMTWTRRRLADRVGAQHRLEAGGESPLDSMLQLCCLGDCTSFLASIITGRDPTPVASIDQLKAEIAR
jgi:glucose/mannose-6-phosphate isomerase